MIKMYNVEVLSKFPVVQHFPFGSLFSWEQDPDAVPPPTSTHISNQPSRSVPAHDQTGQASLRSPPSEGTSAPWAHSATAPPSISAGTAAPWANQASAPVGTPAASAELHTHAPWHPQGAGRSTAPTREVLPPTQAPWAKGSSTSTQEQAQVVTKAPWARSKEG